MLKAEVFEYKVIGGSLDLKYEEKICLCFIVCNCIKRYDYGDGNLSVYEPSQRRIFS